MQGSARKDVVFGAARVYTVTVPGPKWKSWTKSYRFSALRFSRKRPFYGPCSRPLPTKTRTR